MTKPLLGDAEKTAIAREKARIYRLKNKDRINANHRRYVRENKEMIDAMRARNAHKHIQRRKIKDREYYDKHVEAKKQYAKEYHAKAKENGKYHLWYEGYKPRRPSAYPAQKARMEKNPGAKILAHQRTRVNELLKNKNYEFSRTLNLNSTDLRERMERLWLPGMSWQNYGKEWEVDHIIPCVSFDLTQRDQLLQCFSLTNLQPLWKKANRSKWKTVPTQTEIILSC